MTREKEIHNAMGDAEWKHIDGTKDIELYDMGFKEGAEWADKHPFSSSREEILAMLDDKYGTDLSMRFQKLDEEYNELREAANRDVPNTLTLEHCVDYTRDILDELSDVNILIFHIAGIMGVSQDELLSMAVDKIKGREKDPDNCGYFIKKKNN